jgi:hypothetical protein
VQSAEHVAQALERWHERGMGSAELRFWRDQLEGFRTPKAFAYVVDALLDKQDYQAAMGLLMTWLSQSGAVPLVESEHSFYHLALRWMLGVTGAGDESAQAATMDLVMRFFDALEANAEEFWRVPQLDTLGVGNDAAAVRPPQEAAEADDDPFAAAYEGMTYKDSTDDDVESEVLDIMPQKDFDLKQEAPRIESRLRFLAVLAALWNLATRSVRAAPEERRGSARDAATAWLAQARRNYHDLLTLLDRIHSHEVPRPTGAYESIVEYNARTVVKERLLQTGVATCLDHTLAIGALEGVADTPEAPEAPGLFGAPWEKAAREIERALLRRDGEAARALLPAFMAAFRNEPLLFTPLDHGGNPRDVLRASLAQRVLHGLVHSLPRQGLLADTFRLVCLARSMEAGQVLHGWRLTAFDRILHIGLQAITEAIVEAGHRDSVAPERLVQALEEMIEPITLLWIDHGKRVNVRVATLEVVQNDADWERLQDFIRRYGRDLFTRRFLVLPNLRGICHRGIGAWLEQLRSDSQTSTSLRLIEELDRDISKTEAERLLYVILQALIENFDNFQDFNSAAAQSNYGDNLYQLFDFLYLKASYERAAWCLRPVSLIHEVLARHNGDAAALWRQQVEELTRDEAAEHLQELADLEQEHGFRLATIADRLGERFVKPMAIDRLCALVGPALRQARERFDTDQPCPLEEELRPLADTPSGVGWDVPAWVARLEGELRRVRAAESPLGSLIEAQTPVPIVTVPFAQLVEELRDWKQIALEE